MFLFKIFLEEAKRLKINLLNIINDGLVQSVTPVPIFIGINSSRSPEVFQFTEFPFPD